MTTIVVDIANGFLGADSQVSNDSIKWRTDKCRKVGRLWVAACGPATDGLAFEAWLQNKRRKPSLSDEFEALVCHPDGKVEHYVADLKPLPIEPVNQHFAIGSGAAYALGALSAGVCLERALEIAASFDPQSSAPFQIVNYREP